jgi:hypothetical protein
MIPDKIFYPHPHFLPIFCLNLRKKGMDNPRKSHPFYNPGLGVKAKKFHPMCSETDLKD